MAVAQLGQDGAQVRMERGRAPGAGRTSSSCRSRHMHGAGGAHSTLAQCPPALGAVVVGPHGRCPSRLCVPSAVLDLLLCWPQRWPSWGVLVGFGTMALCPHSLPPSPLSVLSVGQRSTLLALTPCLSTLPGSHGRCPGSPQPPHPCCSSGLALGLTLLLGDRDIPALPAVPARHFPCRSTLPSLCHILRPSVMFF